MIRRIKAEYDAPIAFGTDQPSPGMKSAISSQADAHPLKKSGVSFRADVKVLSGSSKTLHSCAIQ